MIFSGLTTLFFSFIRVLLGMFPTALAVPTVTFFDVLGTGINFFGPGLFTLIISNVVFWSTAHLVWSIIEWIYIKIPGVN